MCYVVRRARVEVSTLTTPVARKTYTCELCGLPILPGQRHDRYATLFDGSWWTARMHSDCHDLTQWIQLHVCGQSMYFIEAGSLRRDVREHMGENPDVLRKYRQILRARRAEGVWPVRSAA